MKILLVSQFYYPERFTISDIASELVKRGHEVSVLTGKPNYGYGEIIPIYKNIKYEEINGVKVHRVNLSPRKESRLSIIKNYLSFYFNAKRYVSKLDKDFDVVLSCSLSPVISIAPAIKYAKKHHVKHVLYCLDLWPESTVVTNAVKKDSLMYKILFRWSKKLYHNCDKILISSPSFKEYFSNVLSLNDKEFVYIPQCALLPSEKLDPIVYEDSFNLVYAGNIGKLQNIDLLIKAIKECEEIKLHLIGMGSESNHISKLIEEENLKDKVIFYGPKKVEEVARYYKNADALVVSLSDEGYVGKTLPSKLIQYMYYAKPILGVVGGDSANLIESNLGGITCKSDINSIKNAIEIIKNLSKEQKEKMGENNRNYFLSHFTLEKIAYSIEGELIKSSK